MAARIGAALALLLLCLPVAIVALLWMVLAVLAGSPRGRRLAIGFDQLGNAAGGGDEDEVFSSRCWRLRDRIPYRWLRPAIDWAFARLGDQGHCKRSFDAELKRALNTWRRNEKTDLQAARPRRTTR